MKNYISNGKVLTLTAPGGGVVAGTGVKIGDILVIPTVTKSAGELFTGIVEGVVEHDKLDAQAWTEGQRVLWDDTNKRFTTVTTGNYIAGCAVEVAANPTDKGKVKLYGVSLGAAQA